MNTAFSVSLLLAMLGVATLVALSIVALDVRRNDWWLSNTHFAVICGAGVLFASFYRLSMGITGLEDENRALTFSFDLSLALTLVIVAVWLKSEMSLRSEQTSMAKPVEARPIFNIAKQKINS